MNKPHLHIIIITYARHLDRLEDDSTRVCFSIFFVLFTTTKCELRLLLYLKRHSRRKQYFEWQINRNEMIFYSHFTCSLNFLFIMVKIFFSSPLGGCWKDKKTTITSCVADNFFVLSKEISFLSSCDLKQHLDIRASIKLHMPCRGSFFSSMKQPFQLFSWSKINYVWFNRALNGGAFIGLRVHRTSNVSISVVWMWP